MAGLLREQTQRLAPFFDRFRDLQREMQEEDAFLWRSENSALWFLLSLLTVRSARPLLALDGDALEAAVLDALEGAVRDEAFASELRSAVARCEMLTAPQRHHLEHGLQHAHHAEWLDASPPLLAGLEGAFWSVARTKNLINAERRLVAQPTKAIRGVESLFNKLPVAGDYATFLRHRVFGKSGDPFRHGDADSGERRQVLFGVAALADGWRSLPRSRFAGPWVRAFKVTSAAWPGLPNSARCRAVALLDSPYGRHAPARPRPAPRSSVQRRRAASAATSPSRRRSRPPAADLRRSVGRRPPAPNRRASPPDARRPGPSALLPGARSQHDDERSIRRPGANRPWAVLVVKGRVRAAAEGPAGKECESRP